MTRRVTGQVVPTKKRPSRRFDLTDIRQGIVALEKIR